MADTLGEAGSKPMETDAKPEVVAETAQAQPMEVEDSTPVAGTKRPAAEPAGHGDEEEEEAAAAAAAEGEGDEGDKGEKQADDALAYTERPAEFTSEVNKVVIAGFHERTSVGEIKKLIKKFDLNPVKVKKPHGMNKAYVTFRSAEDKKRCMETMHDAMHRKRKLSVQDAPATKDPFFEQQRQDRQPNKRARGKELNTDIPFPEQLADRVTPMWRTPYEEQLASKQQSMEQALRKVTSQIARTHHGNKKYIKSPCSMQPIIRSPITQGYRNKCEFSIGLDPAGRRTVGFQLGSYQEGMVTVADPTECTNVGDKTKAVAAALQDFVRASPLDVFDRVHHTGHWKMLVVRSSTLGDALANVHIVTQGLEAEVVEKTLADLKAFFEGRNAGGLGLSSLLVTINLHAQKRADEDDEQTRLLFGETKFVEKLLGMEFEVHHNAFFQVNVPATELLLQQIRDWADLTPESGTVLLDVCCGTGTIGICLAQFAKQVVGVEIIEEAVRDARENAKRNGVSNVMFKAGKAEVVLPPITDQLNAPMVAVVDPPRAGLHPKVVQALRRSKSLNRVIYVSCSIGGATQNLVDLCRPESKKFKGPPFQIIKAVAVDLFPSTAHCELVMLLERVVEDEQPAADGTAAAAPAVTEVKDEPMEEQEQQAAPREAGDGAGQEGTKSE